MEKLKGTPLSGEPTLEQLTEALARAESYWRPQTNENKLSHDLLYNLHPIGAPDPKNRKGKSGQLYVIPERMRSGMGARIIKRLRAFYTEPPILSLRPKGLGPRNQAQADKLKVALDETIDQATEAAGEPVWGLLATDAPTYGYAVSLILPAPQVWFDYPTMKEDQDPDNYLKEVEAYESAASVPVVWEHVPSQEFLITSLSRINDEGFWKRKVPAQEIMDRFGEDFEKEGRTLKLGDYTDPYKEVEFITYTNRTHVVYFVKDPGIILRSFEHHMNMCPMVVILGLVTSDKTPGLYFQSALFDVKDLITQTDKRLSELATASRLDAIPPLAVPVTSALPAADEGEGENETIDIQLGGVVPYDPRVSPRPPEWVSRMGQSPVATYAVELGLRLIEETTGLNQAIFGTVGASEAAAAVNLSAEMAKEMYAPLSLNMAIGYRRTATAFMKALQGFIFMHPESIQNDVRITLRPKEEAGPEIVLKKKDLEGWDVLLATEYKPKLPQHRNANLGMAISLSAAKDASQQGRPLVDFTWLRDNLMDIEDGAEIDKRWLIDAFVYSQPTIETYRQQALNEAQIEFRSQVTANPQQVTQALQQAPPEAAQTFNAMGLTQQSPGTASQSGVLPPEATLQSAQQTGQLERGIQQVREAAPVG